MASTKIDLITGFLGAGKTTLIRRYTALLRAGGVSCAVIENEFGAAGVDAAVLERDGVRVRELSGGCVCCTQKLNFHDAMHELSHSYQRVIVEPSGIFRADDFISMLASPTLRGQVEVGMLLCVVEPELPALDSPAAQVLRDELAFAGSAYISHTDVVSREAVEQARLRLIEMGIAPERVFAKPVEQLTLDDFEQMSGGVPERRRFAPTDVAHATAFQSTTLKPTRTFTCAEAETALKALREAACGRVLRAKGQLNGPDGVGLSVNMTPNALSVEYCAGGETYLNVIGEHLNRRSISALFN